MIGFLPRPILEAVDRLDLRLEVPVHIPDLEVLLSRTVLDGGKRFRPVLCFLTGSLLGVPLEKVAPYARVAEFIHAATLAHDDVIDEAATRRRKPTLNAEIGNARAVLAGDILLARVVREIAALGNLQILDEGAKVLEDLVQGEWLQLDRRDVIQTERSRLEAAAEKKTSSLIAWCCTTPGRLSQGSPELIEHLRALGVGLGLIFQMADDIIDFEENGEKPFAQDLREGLVNFVTFELLGKHPELSGAVSAWMKTPRLESRPWTPAQLEDAKRAVRAAIQANIETLRGELGRIIELGRVPAPDQDPAAIALFQILEYLAERDF